jgi:hypothetical protein
MEQNHGGDPTTDESGNGTGHFTRAISELTQWTTLTPEYIWNHMGMNQTLLMWGSVAKSRIKERNIRDAGLISGIFMVTRGKFEDSKHYVNQLIQKTKGTQNAPPGFLNMPPTDPENVETIPTRENPEWTLIEHEKSG